MDTIGDNKRKQDKRSDNDDYRKKKKTRRHRSRSRSSEERDRDVRRKRRHSRSRSRDAPMNHEKRREDSPKDTSVKNDAPIRKTKETDMLNTRTGGAYIPPARLRMMQAQITDKSSIAYQRLAWEALKKSIHGHINKINVGNIGIIIKELLKENIVRGRGLLCRSVIQAQAASPTFTNVYAALVAAVNSRFPNIGELLLKRLVIQFKRGFKRNDKPICISSASFIAHLVNQRVAHEILALELLTLLVESPTDDSVEVAIAFLKECGLKLTEVSSKGVNAIFEMLRNILHEGQLDKRVQYMIEVMFQVWKDGFKDHPALIDELELVPEEEQFTHLLMLDDATDPQDILNVFKFDEKYEDNEQKYKTLSKEILGSDAESGEEDGTDESGSGESDDEEEQEGEQKGLTIIDNTETNLVALRRTIYLTINSSLDFEECAHKLMKMQLKPGQEVELCHMFLDCCAEQRTYEKFYGLLAQRFCNINRMYIGPFEEIFKDSYATAHRLDTNRLRNVSKFFAHLLFTDSISWEVMECVKLNEEDTTSSSRIYIKILFQELAEYMGLKKLNDRLKDPTLQDAFSGIFPRDNPKNTRFSINFFTSIGLGGLTDELREHLKQMPKNVPAPITDINVESDSSSSDSSSSDSSSSDSSSSDSEDDNKKKKRSAKSKDKEISKPNNDSQKDASNKENNDSGERWGHDRFYDTYGENARRYENRPEKSQSNNDSYGRSRDADRRTRRHDDGERQKESELGNRYDRNNHNLNRYQNEKETGETEERRRNMERRNRSERDYNYEKRRDNTENIRNERNTEYNRRYDNDRSERDHSNKDDKRKNDDKVPRKDGRSEDKKKDKDSRRDYDDNSTDRHKSNDDTIRNRIERETGDKNSDKNNKERKDDQNKSMVDSTHKINEKNVRKSEKQYRSTEDKYNRGKDRNNTNKNDKYNDSSDEGDSRNSYKESRNKGKRADDKSKYTVTKDDNQREDKIKKNKNTDRNYSNSKSKKDKKEKESKNDRDKESLSSESDSTVDNSNDEQKGGRYWDMFDIKGRKYLKENHETKRKDSNKI